MKHLCHWPDCCKEVPPKMWGCIYHWYKLPNFIRSRIYLTYRPGQEIMKNPSKSYLVAASAAQKWIELMKVHGSEAATKAMEDLIYDKGWPDEPKIIKEIK